MTKFEEEFNYLIELSGKVLIGQVDAEAFEKNRIAFFEKYETDQQQALPVVPECVGEYIEECKKEGDCLFGIFADATRVEHDMPDLVYFWLGDEGNNDELFARAWLDGYTVEKPQLFKLIFPNSTAVLQKDGELNSFADTVYKRYLIENAMTEQEIKSIDERYWQFAVPVEVEK